MPAPQDNLFQTTQPSPPQQPALTADFASNSPSLTEAQGMDLIVAFGGKIEQICGQSFKQICSHQLQGQFLDMAVSSQLFYINNNHQI
jgi:hypothetical protein